jgi:hypothetical protein
MVISTPYISSNHPNAKIDAAILTTTLSQSPRKQVSRRHAAAESATQEIAEI